MPDFGLKIRLYALACSTMSIRDYRRVDRVIRPRAGDRRQPVGHPEVCRAQCGRGEGAPATTRLQVVDFGRWGFPVAVCADGYAIDYDQDNMQAISRIKDHYALDGGPFLMKPHSRFSAPRPCGPWVIQIYSSASVVMPGQAWLSQPSAIRIVSPYR